MKSILNIGFPITSFGILSKSELLKCFIFIFVFIFTLWGGKGRVEYVFWHTKFSYRKLVLVDILSEVLFFNFQIS